MIHLSKFGAKFIPLIKNGKTPAGRFKGINFSTEQLKQHRKNGGNIGLLAQPNFVFLDIDQGATHGGVDGLQNFNNWLEDHGMQLEPLLDSTLVQKTPTNGIHIIFLQPKQEQPLSYNQAGSSAGRLTQDIGMIPGVDIKASNNNYILIYPSEIDGKQYHFLNDKEPIEMPAKLAAALHEEEAKAQRAKRSEAKRTIVEGTPDDHGLVYRNNGRFPQLDVFYTIANGFGAQGHRNDAVFEWSKAMRRITDEQTTIAYAKIANQHSTAPLPLREIVSTIKSAYSYQTSLASIAASGHTWVILKSKIDRDLTAVQAVLRETYRQNGSPYYQDYEPGLLYSAAKTDQSAPASIKRTVWNYHEGGRE